MIHLFCYGLPLKIEGNDNGKMSMTEECPNQNTNGVDAFNFTDTDILESSMNNFFPKEELDYHVRLVRFIIIRNFGISEKSPNYDDYVSDGTIGLVKAYNSFDWSKNIKFSTYATTCITNEILQTLRKEKKRNRLQSISLEQIVGYSSDGESALTLKDTIPTSDDYTHIDLPSFIASLTDRQKAIVEMTLNDYNQSDIGEELGISQSYASRLLKEVFVKLEMFINGIDTTGKKKRTLMEIVNEYSIKEC